MCSSTILPPYHHLLLHLSFLQCVPTLFLLFFSFSLSSPSPSSNCCPAELSYLHDLETLKELTEKARDFTFIRIIRNELTL